MIIHTHGLNRVIRKDDVAIPPEGNQAKKSG